MNIRKFFSGVSVGSDISLTVFLQGLTGLLALGLQPLIARKLGPNGWSTYSLCMQTYATIGSAILDFGIFAFVFPKVAVSKNFASLPFASAIALRIPTFLLATIVTLGVAFAFGNGEYWYLILSGLFVVFIGSRFPGMRQVMEMIWRNTGRTWVAAGVGVLDMGLFILALLLIPEIAANSVISVIVTFFVANVPGFLIITIPIIRRYLQTPNAPRRVPIRYLKRVAIGSSPIALMVLSAQVFGRVEPLIINAVFGEDLVGGYMAAILPIGGTAFIASTIGIGLQPLIAQAWRGTRNDVKGEWILSIGTRILGSVGILIGVFCFIYAEPILSLFGPKFIASAWILRIYALTNLLELMVMFYDQSLIGINKHREVMGATIGALILALILQIIGVIFWGLPGILFGKMATVACKIVYQLTLFSPVWRREAIYSLARIGGSVLFFAAGIYGMNSLDLSPIVEGVILLPAVVGALFFLKVIDLPGILKLRSIRLG
ncbi:MAG: hypothetical protein AB7H80_07055 [Candidatus Kapaibacterium sp.]